MKDKFLYTTIGLLIGVIVTVACAPVQSFAPTGSQRFEPRQDGAEVVVYETPPDRPHEVIGYAECRGNNMGDALPYLKKMAKANGGDGLLKIESVSIFTGVYNYRAAVIRFTDNGAAG